MCEAGEESKAKENIKNFLHQCNLGDEKIVPKSITNIIMKEQAFKQEISL